VTAVVPEGEGERRRTPREGETRGDPPRRRETSSELPLRSCQRTFLYENKTNKWRASDVGRNGKRNGMSMRRLVSSRRSRCSARGIRADRARADCGARCAPSDACASRRSQGGKKLQGALQGEISNLLLSVKGKVSRAKRAR